MYFILNDSLFFRPDDGAVWHKSDENEKIILTPTVSRLLVLLLEQQGEVIPREEIFHKVWDNWGMEGSSHSLNHFISQLRKVFSTFNLPDTTITTIPRIGFMLSSEIDIKKIVVGEEQKPQRLEKVKLNIKDISKPLLLLSILMVVCSGLYYFSVISGDNLSYSPRYLGENAYCSVYSLDDYEDITTEHSFKIAMAFLNERSAACKDQAVIFFHADKSVYFSQPGKVYTATCHGSVESFNTCVNMMDRAWRYREKFNKN